ncbi:4'-phosphopantetheinyl transferase family protein [Flavobacterium cellulosilyticum]|uniref:4'-phosphopantetheinyl transferase superfamily protein n=1 Tax=Flavobacterium cellulosilyticum TaxID=2541731 RepID=A0A4R5C815_9FLAO|nr:4'-phosphopantetheinyl transferase superfamily protein [Flavobacterium cellulosilyticum]TDD94736.1 4'-phosphopantetheinyl transferase superfamily protein [Flavobacterium cellulosilyticum]
MQTSNLFITFSNIKGVSLPPRKEYALNENDIIIYTIYLPNFIAFSPYLSNFLNNNELNRADRFYSEKDKNRFIICRSILKFVIAAFTNLDAKNISLDYRPNKKPYLDSHPWFCFNISHSEDIAVIAISKSEVGIDIEHISDNFDFTTLLSAIFNEKEISAIQNANNKKLAFYTSWTRKEAFVKALGKGIDDEFKNFPCLDGHHNLNSKLIKTSEYWQVNSFEIAQNYIGAIAYNKDANPKNIEMFNMPSTMDSLLELIKYKV